LNQYAQKNAGNILQNTLTGNIRPSTVSNFDQFEILLYGISEIVGSEAPVKVVLEYAFNDSLPSEMDMFHLVTRVIF
jgi:hypothetical protein